jgi:hypothetical protein
MRFVRDCDHLTALQIPDRSQLTRKTSRQGSELKFVARHVWAVSGQFGWVTCRAVVVGPEWLAPGKLASVIRMGFFS